MKYNNIELVRPGVFDTTVIFCYSDFDFSKWVRVMVNYSDQPHALEQFRPDHHPKSKSDPAQKLHHCMLDPQSRWFYDVGFAGNPAA